MTTLLAAIVIGSIATALLDLWNLLLNRLFGFGLPNWGMVGRWFGHLPGGTLLHPAGIAKSAPVASEPAIGWVMHYLIGILFAWVMLLLWPHWRAAPTVMPALIVGWVTILCGWLILSPGLGNGLAHAKTAAPMRARLLNIAGHTVFGLGLWLGGLLLA